MGARGDDRLVARKAPDAQIEETPHGETEEESDQVEHSIILPPGGVYEPPEAGRAFKRNRWVGVESMTRQFA
jgi:hypothetical protein